MVFVRRCLVLAALLGKTALSASCPDDPDVDLCDTTTTAASDEKPEASAGMRSVSFVFLLPGALGGSKLQTMVLLPLISLQTASAAATTKDSTCKHVKDAYKAAECCGNPDQGSGLQVVPRPTSKGLFHGATNPCNGRKPTGNNWDNWACMSGNVVQAIEQSGADVTEGYQGELNASGRTPITGAYFGSGLCPVNVHWHWGAEHRSAGEYDEEGTGPTPPTSTPDGMRRGFQCRKYVATDAKFTTEYDWKHCVDMVVGETYEVHWPHSAAGMCGTPYQYQTPFYDGVFCVEAAVNAVLAGQITTYDAIGVQGQVFTIVNDEAYYYPDLMRGWIQNGDFAQHVTKYTGSTTGTSRNNDASCSRYGPVTWQVDRKCHLISASSFDKMCADMKQQLDDMSGDLHAHGARELVANKLAADNQHHRRE